MAKFSEILTIVNGKNQKKVENDNGKYPIYGSGGIMGYADDYLCEANTVIIGRKGSINKPIFVEEPFWNVDTAFGLSANRNVLLPKYLFYFCVNYDFEKLNTTVTIPSLTKANLLDIELELPPIEEQKIKVSILSLIDNLISLRKQQLAKLDEMVKSRFIELFGDPLSNYMGWPATDMKAICKKITDGEHGSVARVASGNVFLNAKHIKKDGTIDWQTVTYTSDEVHNKIYARCNPEPGDILLTTTGTIGNVAIVPDVAPFSMDRGVTLLKLNGEKVNNTFIAALLRFEGIKAVMNANVHASAIGHLFLNHVMKIPVIVPPIELQEQFAAFVEQTDKSKLAIQQSLDKLETLKKALMQKYFG